MRKEFGKWLMDISKYIVTAVILSSFFKGVEEETVVYVGGIIAVIITVGWGLYLHKEPPAKKKRRK
jgi:uncharacterized membrane protein